MPAGKLSLVVHIARAGGSQAALDGTRSAGCWSTSGSRSCRAARETTALTFQFNPPDACAPQSHAARGAAGAGRSRGRSPSLHRVLLETLDLAQAARVDAESLGELAHYLPALYFAFNAKDDAVSTDFAPD